jgi:hypothetical protein
MILIINFYAFILYVSDSDLQCNKHNSYWYGVQYQDRQTALGSWYGPVEIILPLPPARAISFPLVLTTTLGQSVYPDIALHISNYFINIPCDCGQYTRIFSRGTLNCIDVLYCRFWLSCLNPLFFFLSNIFKLFGFQIFWIRAYKINVIPEPCSVH